MEHAHPTFGTVFGVLAFAFWYCVGVYYLFRGLHKFIQTGRRRMSFEGIQLRVGGYRGPPPPTTAVTRTRGEWALYLAECYDCTGATDDEWRLLLLRVFWLGMCGRLGERKAIYFVQGDRPMQPEQMIHPRPTNPGHDFSKPRPSGWRPTLGIGLTVAEASDALMVMAKGTSVIGMYVPARKPPIDTGTLRASHPAPMPSCKPPPPPAPPAMRDTGVEIRETGRLRQTDSTGCK